LGHDFNGDETMFTPSERNSILIRNERLYQHKTVRINFTTYDVRRSQDSLNPHTSHCDLLVWSGEDTTATRYHPFWYARLLGVFHAHVCRMDPKNSEVNTEWQPMPFLWVRWFGRSDPQARASINPHRLDRIGFVTADDNTEPFGFLDPSNVVRACHIIPAFAYGRTNALLGPSIARKPQEKDTDWQYYYVNR
jgi:hypothetical protein